MDKSKLVSFLKKPSLILALILLAFFIKGVFLADLFPIFSGQDEAKHYNTVQFKLEPKNKNLPMSYDVSVMKRGDFSTYNYSQEIRETASTINSYKIKSEPYDAMSFNDGYEGKGEDQINSKQWMLDNNEYSTDIAGGGLNLYHTLASYIEKFLSSKSILVRFFSIRVFSVLLGTLTIYLAYLIAVSIGFSRKISLLLTAIISFLPALSIYYISINYDALLILVFALFTLGGILSLKEGLNVKNALMMAASVAIGILTKETAIVLLPVFVILVFYALYKNHKAGKFNAKYLVYFLVLLLVVFLILFQSYSWDKILNLKKGVGFIDGIKSLDIKNYVSESFGMGRILQTGNGYWGNLGWEENIITGNALHFIWIIEAFSVVGLAMFFFSKKKYDYLPEKKYVLFLILMIITLQLGIRYADLTLFSRTGEIYLGAPGRYFLPNLISHFILIFTGLGALFKKNYYLDISLKIGLILSISYCFYIIFDIVIPRFYL